MSVAPRQLLELVDSLDAIVWEGDARALSFTFVSQRAEAILGYPIRQWLEDPDFWVNHIHPEDRDRAVEKCVSATQASEDHSFEYRFIAADGRIVWLRDVVRVFPDSEGRPHRARGVMIDVTEQKRVAVALAESEAALARTESQFRAVVEHGNDLVSILEPSGVVRYASPSHETQLGWAPAELEGRNAFDFVHEEDVPSLAAEFAQGVGIPGFITTREFRFRHKDGSWRTMEGRASNMLHDPVIRGAVINSRDVTERKTAETRLRQRLEFEQLIADVSTSLANADSAGLDAAIHAALGAVARAVGAQRGFIAIVTHERGSSYVRYEWTAEGRAPIGADLQNLQPEVYPWFLSEIVSRGWVALESTTALPPEASGERRLMEFLNLKSGRSVRMVARGRILGFINCSFEHEPPRSLEEDLQLLRVIGEMCANAIARQREENAKTALLELARNLGGTFDLREMLGPAQKTIAASLPCDRVAVYHVSEGGESFEVIAAYGFEEVGFARIASFSGGHPLRDVLRHGKLAVSQAPDDQDWFTPEILAGADVGPWALAPLMVRGELRGMVGVGRRPGTRPFSTAEIELFEGMARQISLAVRASEMYQSKEAEAAVASALARLGRELISSLDQPVLLERLTRLTAEVFGYDVSSTYLWRDEDQAFIGMAGHGYSREEAEAIRVVRLKKSMVAALLARLENEDVVQLVGGEGLALFPRELVRRSKLKSAVYIALRRGSEVVGALMAGSRSNAQPFGADELRIARGIGQLASLALANTRVVDELERLSRLKSDFVATMSHELRTPLNVIMGYNDLLLDGAFGEMPQDQNEVVDRMKRSAGELLELINATLDVSRLDSGRLPVDRSRVALPDLLAEIEVETRQMRPKNGVCVQWEREPNLPPLFSDAVKIKVIVKNLVGNALKFTDSGSVRVAARCASGGVEISVADTGIGISRESQAVIFEAFRQADGSATRRHGGVGLGLYIVRRLLDLLGGTISLESELHQGSTFRIWLPIDDEAGLHPSS